MDAFDVLVKEINDQVSSIQEAICSGRPNSFDEYKRLCGEVRGLLIARDIAKDLKKRMENPDD
jgi:hypothetical protein